MASQIWPKLYRIFANIGSHIQYLSIWTTYIYNLHHHPHRNYLPSWFFLSHWPNSPHSSIKLFLFFILVKFGSSSFLLWVFIGSSQPHFHEGLLLPHHRERTSQVRDIFIFQLVFLLVDLVCYCIVSSPQPHFHEGLLVPPYRESTSQLRDRLSSNWYCYW